MMKDKIFFFGSNVVSGIISGIVVIYLNNEGFTKMAYLVVFLYISIIALVCVYIIKNWNITKTATSSICVKNKKTITRIKEDDSSWLNGVSLSKKWGLGLSDLLSIVLDCLIPAYAPDDDIVINENKEQIKEAFGFYSNGRQTDKQILKTIRFKPKDIVRFEKIAKGFQVDGTQQIT